MHSHSAFLIVCIYFLSTHLAKSRTWLIWCTISELRCDQQKCCHESHIKPPFWWLLGSLDPLLVAFCFLPLFLVVAIGKGQLQNRRFRAVFRGGQEFSDPKIVLSKGPLEKTLEIRRFCVLLHKKWFGTNSEHAFVSSAEWFGTKLLSSDCFSHVQNGVFKKVFGN